MLFGYYLVFGYLAIWLFGYLAMPPAIWLPHYSQPAIWLPSYPTNPAVWCYSAIQMWPPAVRLLQWTRVSCDKRTPTVRLLWQTHPAFCSVVARVLRLLHGKKRCVYCDGRICLRWACAHF